MAVVDDRQLISARESLTRKTAEAFENLLGQYRDRKLTLKELRFTLGFLSDTVMPFITTDGVRDISKVMTTIDQAFKDEVKTATRLAAATTATGDDTW